MTNVHGQPISYGWVFFVSPIHILTNLHVVAWTAAGTAKLVDNSQTFPIQGITAADRKNDLALLKVSIPNFKPLHLVDNYKVQQDEHVYVVANPHRQGAYGTFFESSINYVNKQGDKKNSLMTISFTPFNSGLPVLNRKGKVIGVTSMEFTRSAEQVLYFVIPSEYVKTLRDEQGKAMHLADSKK